jgi:hypothetical protein
LILSIVRLANMVKFNSINDKSQGVLTSHPRKSLYASKYQFIEVNDLQKIGLMDVRK